MLSRTRCWSISILISIAILLGAATAGAQCDAVSLPSDDAWVYEHPGYQGSGTLDFLVTGLDFSGYEKRMYLKFDNLDQIPPGTVVTRAEVWICCKDAHPWPEYHDMHHGHDFDDGWSETTVSWTNCPETNPDACDTVFVDGPDYYGWDVTPEVNYEITSGNGILTLMVKPSLGMGAEYKWVSREGAMKFVPFLYLEFDNDFILTVIPDPMDVGQNVKFKVTHGGAWADTYLIYSMFGPGSTYIPRLDVTCGLAYPKLAAGPTRNNPYGQVEWNITCPYSLYGKTIWFQAVHQAWPCLWAHPIPGKASNVVETYAL